MKINTKIITYFLGFLLLINGGFMFLSALLSYIYKDGITGDLLLSGTISELINRFAQNLYDRIFNNF